MSKQALVFPGQGSQSLEMGKESFENDSEIKAIYEKADEIFAEFHSQNDLNPKSISKVSFNGPEEKLAQTIYTQPAILTLSIALASKLKQQIAAGHFKKPLYVAGHSLGEFSALYMADVLSLEDCLKLVIKRADLMQKAPEGGMAAVVGLDEAKLNELIASIDNASVANYNSPEQIVITGTKAAMLEAQNKIESFASENSLKIRFIMLNVGGAFHSPLMQEASLEFTKLIDDCAFNDATIPVIQNITAEAVTNKEQIKENLKQQMTGAVSWTKTVKILLEEVEEILELGPGKVLAGLVKKQDRRFPVKNIASSSELEALNPISA